MVIKAWSRLLRLPNLIILAFSQFLLFYFLIRPFFETDELALNTVEFILLLFSFTLVCASGNVINAIFDRHIDAMRATHLIIPKYFSLKFSWMLYVGFITLGAAISFYLAYRTHQIILWWFYPICVFLLWIYSYKLKCFPLLGNLLVATFTGLAMLFIPFAFRENMSELRWMDYPLWAQLNYRFVMLGIFAVLCNLCRELCKDLEDFIPDSSQFCESTAVYYGISTTKFMTVFCLIALSVVLIFDIICQHTIFNQLLNGIFLLGPVIYCSYLIQKANYLKDFSQVSRYLKFIMLFGIILFCILYEF